jgi:hypothetical protein
MAVTIISKRSLEAKPFRGIVFARHEAIFTKDNQGATMHTSNGVRLTGTKRYRLLISIGRDCFVPRKDDLVGFELT